MTDSNKSEKYSVFLEWTSPMRVYKKHHKQDYIMVIVLALSITALFFIVRQYMLIAVVIAVVFLVFVMWSVPPDSVKHKLTTVGIYSIDRLYEWDKLRDYWFTVIDGMYVLNVSTNINFPRRFILLIGEAKEADKIHGILSDYLKYQLNKRQNFLDIWIDGKYVPLEENTINPEKQPDLDHKALTQVPKNKK
ncbi:hypothetical protein JW962_04180 [Candidatus Dojkabacteria bacterium]|nr:hypothetical protein [Candidatus Dojkabacteria bacterium]